MSHDPSPNILKHYYVYCSWGRHAHYNGRCLICRETVKRDYFPTLSLWDCPEVWHNECLLLTYVRIP